MILRLSHLARLLCFLLPWLASLAAQAEPLPLAVDLRQEAAAAAQRGAVLLVLYSRTDCPYCRTVRKNYLQPLRASGDQRVNMVELVIDRDTPLRDFQGKTTSAPEFAARQGIKLAPVVAFYGGHGEKTAQPLVGALLPDFYTAYLETAISESQRVLRR